MNLLIALFFLVSSLFVDEQPVFKGGQNKLTVFIYNNLIYPEYSRDNCIQGTIQVSFKLNQEGKIYHSEVTKGFGIDLDQEALRIVRLTSGKWTMPANHDTSISMVLPVNFSLKDYKCEERSKDEIKAAISAYNGREGLKKVVFNYYDLKIKGKNNPADEARIEAIKMQLGFNTKYVDRLLKQAQYKIKQGDRQGACEDFQTIRLIGSDKSDQFLKQYCQ
ncbi:TonB family protein [Daejeonella sp.]|uniref:TonB family protein n=1 Tax=Daejeonella sp. TaxID=2805397 RepID=UPI0025BBEBDB|nr:TonB family protein [Daejeonella sp.]